ncbi:ABC transporter ATP-binding protein [Candidatus Poribacteria bacterium]
MTSPASEESLSIGSTEELPEAIQEYLENLSEKEADIRVAVSSDMNLDGEFEESWLLATDNRVLVFSGNHVQEPELIHDLRIEDIKDVELKSYIGNGILEIHTADKAIELLRFSKTAFLQSELAEVPNAINVLRERSGQEVEKRRGHSGEREREREREHGHRHSFRCENCGRMTHRGVCSHCLEKRTMLARLFGYLVPYWRIVAIAFSLLLLTTILGLIPTYITKMLTDDVFVPAIKAIADGLTPGPEISMRLNMLVLAILGIHIINTGLGALRSYMMRWLGNKVIYDLRTSAYEYLQRLSLSFYNKKETGRLMSRISRDTERLQGFIVRGLQEFLMDILMLTGMCVVLFVVNWRLAALTLIPVPGITVASVIFGKKMHIVFHKVMRRMAGISAILADTIPGVRVVKAFAAEDREVDRFNAQSIDYFRTSMYAAKLSTIYFPLMGLGTFLGGIMIRFFGGRSLLAGEMSLGDLMLFMGYMWRFYRPVMGLTRLNETLQRSAAAAERVFEIMDAQPEVEDKKDAIELPTIQGDIEFDDVVFSYDDENNALDGISFQVKAGQMVGLSGPSGAGKTTLINLIGRFYDVTEGAIYVDGHDVRDVTMRSLRDQIGIVLQEPFLFHGSIAENIAYGNPRAARAEIIAAAKTANAHDFIMKAPDGYDTLLGERGTGLSGGERQRISIARAILKNPRILVLDEATSSVDTETESLIQAAIERLIEGRTTFAIAHRLSTLRKADKLLILDKGEITEQGSHNELLANNGLYKRLVDMQSELSSIKTV